MTDTIDEEITADVVASQVEFERDAHDGAIIIVEGDSDSHFFKKIIDEENCKIVIAAGKENATGAIYKLNKEDFSGVLCIVDSDFCCVGHVDIDDTNNIAMTDFHDIEILLFESPSFDKLVEGFGSKHKIASALNGDRNNLRDLIYEPGVLIGAFKLWSKINSHNLTFKKLGDKGYAFININDLSCDIQSLIRSVKHASAMQHLVDSDVEKAILEISSSDLDKRHLCCGHDICWIISRALRKLIGSHQKESVSKENIERILIIGYEKCYFLTTQLYQKILKWEAINPGYKILDNNFQK
ncbi:hypothetical protein DFW101_0335 [Solidesulfovibrio carbinoliphilus subsp. oakridgensis]|uniref:DUF4435 domain-containing protein n=1 Tax=Solidesulfovibrio carbinoliphilus subsp. oakridgensis TaxID=694327 RepID=G7QD46_9BACT|nr:DUF4435 domain-containing protein [Solidesulfovibrio carbinoliphilus]EHJ46352.1 hypothetical protein DFW101_0335 [Solidesulfovibrio carbinoliphilus subsp. oakridgensis]